MNAEAYGVKYNPSTRTFDGLTTEVFDKWLSDYPTLLGASQALGISRHSLRKMEKGFKKYWPKISTPPEHRIELNWERDKIQHDILCAKWENYTGWATYFACTHFPFADWERINEMVELCEGKLGRVVIAGDLLDSYNLSVFRKSYDISPMKECQMAVDGIKLLKEYSDSITILTANHEARFMKRMADSLPPDLLEMDEVLRGGKTPIDFIAEHAMIEGTKLWWMRNGDTIVAHPERALSATLGTVKRAARYFSIRQDGINNVLVAHPHQLGYTIYRKMYCAEIGCMSRTMDYTLTGNITAIGEDVMQTGFQRAWYENGAMNHDKSKLYPLGGDTMTCPKCDKEMTPEANDIYSKLWVCTCGAVLPKDTKTRRYDSDGYHDKLAQLIDFRGYGVR